MNNPRIIHLLLGGHNVGKTVFARFLQIGKHNIFRVSLDEQVESVGSKNVDDWYHALCHFFLVHGDIVVDDIVHNSAIARRKLIGHLNNKDIGYIIYAYVVKRPVENCFDEYHEDEEIIESHRIDYPRLSEGIERILTVTWEGSRDIVNYSDNMTAMRPQIAVMEEAPPSVIVRSRKKIIKNKLKRGKQNILIPRPKDGK